MSAVDPPPGTVLVYVGGDLIGDALMKLPFVRALRGAWPDARVTWLAGVHPSAFARDLAPLTAGLIDEVVEAAGFGGWGTLLRRPFGGRRFDLVLDTQRGLPAAARVRRIRHGVFVSAAGRYLLSDRKPDDGAADPPSMIGRMMRLLDLCTGGATPEGPPLPVDPGRAARAAELLPAGPAYVGFAPGAGGQHKRWPLERFVDLARREADSGRVPVFVLGPGEAGMADALRAAVPAAVVPEETAGGGHLADPVLSIALARRLAAAVANDAGSGHILAAGGAPLVSLFGPTPAAKFAPAAARLRVVRAQDHGGDEMTAIPVAAVAAALDDLLGGQG